MSSEPRSPKSSKANSPKVIQKRAQSITFINNTDALFLELSSGGIDVQSSQPSLSTMPSTTLSSSKQPRRGMSPAWASRSPGDQTPSSQHDPVLTTNTSTVSFEIGREAYPASMQRRNSFPASGLSNKNSLREDVARQLPTPSKSFSYFVHHADDISGEDSVEVDPSVSGATHVYRGTTPTRNGGEGAKAGKAKAKKKKASVSPMRQSGSKSPLPRHSPSPAGVDVVNESGYSLDSFRAFQSFPKGKVLKAKSVNTNANNSKCGRPQPKYNKRPEAELFQYAYSAHPIYSGGTTTKTRSARPASPGRGGGSAGLMAKGVAVGPTSQAAPKKTTTHAAGGRGSLQKAHQHRRSVIETYAAGLPPPSSRTLPGGHAHDEADEEGNVGPLDDLAERKEMAIALAKVPAFSHEVYKDMHVPYRLVKEEPEEQHEEDFMTDTIHHNILMERQQGNAANPLFEYLSGYKMEDTTTPESEKPLGETVGGVSKTVRFADTGMPNFAVTTTVPDNLPGYNLSAPLFSSTTPAENPLGVAPLSGSVRDNPLGGVSTTNPGATPLRDMIPLAGSYHPTPLQPSLGAPPAPVSFPGFASTTGLPGANATTTIPPPAPTAESNSNPFGLLSTGTPQLPGLLPAPSSSETPLPGLGDNPLARPKLDSSATELDGTLRPDQMLQPLPGTAVPAADATAAPPPANLYSVPLKKEELKLTEDEKEELEFIRRIYMAKKSAEKFGDRGARAVPDHVLFASKQKMQWQLQTLKERHTEQYAKLSDAQKMLFDDAAQMRLYHHLLDEKTGVDYQSIVEDVLHPERAARLLQDLYAKFISPIVENEMTRKQRANDTATRARMADRVKQRKTTVASQAVLLRDPVKLLACEHLSYADTGARNRSMILANANASISRQDLQSMVGSVLRQVPPSGATFCELSYAAKVLLSAVLYIRALGGFPTLLRVQPLTDLSAVIDKENCIELVFWNTHEVPQETAAAAAAATATAEASAHRSTLGEPQPPAPVRQPSMIGSTLTRALSSVMTRNASISNPRGTTTNGMPSILDVSTFLSQPISTSHSSLLAHPAAVAPPPGADGEPETVNAGSERLPGPAVPRVDASVSKCVRRSSSTLHRPSAGKDDTTVQQSFAARSTMAGTPPPQPVSVGSAETARAAQGDKNEPPCPPTGKGRSRIREAHDEMCVVVRALVAQKSTVYRFGQEEVVHVLPPLPRIDEYIQQQAAQQVDDDQRAAERADPLLKAPTGESQAAKRRAAEAKQRSIQERNRRLSSRKVANLDGKGSPQCDDYGDLAVAFLLSGGASELSGVLPDVMELETLRYKLFTLQGYNTKDPHGVNRERPDSSTTTPVPPGGRRATEATGTSMVGAALLDTMSRSPSRRRSTFESELFNRYGYSSAQTEAETRAEQQQQRARREELARAKRKAIFPLYRASSVAERTLQEYHLLEKAKARARRARLLQEGAKLEDDDHDDDDQDTFETAVGGANSRSSSNANLNATLQKNMNLREAEKELLRFRPLNLNGFYNEMLEAVQLALDEQVR